MASQLQLVAGHGQQRLSHGPVQGELRVVAYAGYDRLLGWGSGYGVTITRGPPSGANYGHRTSMFITPSRLRCSMMPFGKGRQFLNSNRSWICWWEDGRLRQPSYRLWRSLYRDYEHRQFLHPGGNSKQFANQVVILFRLIGISNTGSALRFCAAHSDIRRRAKNNLYGPEYLLINRAISKTFHLPGEYGNRNSRIGKQRYQPSSFDIPNATINGGTEGQVNNLTVYGRTMQLYGYLL